MEGEARQDRTHQRGHCYEPAEPGSYLKLSGLRCTVYDWKVVKSVTLVEGDPPMSLRIAYRWFQRFEGQARQDRTHERGHCYEPACGCKVKGVEFRSTTRVCRPTSQDRAHQRKFRCETATHTHHRLGSTSHASRAPTGGCSNSRCDSRSARTPEGL